jgi:hypothetical protein
MKFLHLQAAYLKLDYINYTANPNKAFMNIELDNRNEKQTLISITVNMTEKRDAEKIKV